MAWALAWSRLRRFGAAGAALAAAAGTWLVLAWAQPTWFAGVEDRGSDWAWRLLAAKADERRLVIVDIDERSLAELGPWPWPRDLQARLIDRLAAAGASTQVLDVVFPDPRPGDDALSRAIAAHRPVLAQVFALPGQGDQARAGLPGGALPGLRCASPFQAASGFIANDPVITRAATQAGAAIGHITPRLSGDGVVRRQPALLCHEGSAYPALALATLMAATGEPTVHIAPGPGPFGPAWQVRWPRGGLAPVPLDARGDLLLPWWRSPDSWVGLSAADVLAGRVPSGLLQGAWVLVGSTAFGLNDTIATPFAAGASGTQVHAQLIAALLDDRVPFVPRAAPLLQALAALACLVLVGLLVGLLPRPGAGGRTPAPARRPGRWRLPRVGLPWLPLLGLGAAGGLYGLHVLALALAGWSIGWLLPVVAVVTGALTWAMVEHRLSRIERDRIYGHLASYLPEPVAAALAAQGPSSAVSAHTRQVSVLFADIRNFSAYCEARPPEETAAVLHAFFSVASRIVEAEGGVIESFQGDAVMAVWGRDEAATSAAPQQARSALRAALQLYASIQGVLPDPAPAGLEPLGLGIGLESGPATAGDLGLASRRTHMVMGRTVTIARRLVDMTADLGYPILIGEGMAAQTAGGALQSLGTFMLEGMKVAHHVYACTAFAAPRLDTGLRAGGTQADAGIQTSVQADTQAALSSYPAPRSPVSSGRYTH